MSDPLGLIAGVHGLPRMAPHAGSRADAVRDPSQDFRQVLNQQLAQVNDLQHDATIAVEDLAAGRRDDVDGVIIATQKADLAFQMLLQFRNKLMEAYDEIKQIRV